MRSRLINAMVMSAALSALPAIGSAAPPSMMHGCVQAFERELTAGASKPMKVVEGREVTDVATFGMPEYLLTARDAQSAKTIASAVCTSDRRGGVVLQINPSPL